MPTSLTRTVRFRARHRLHRPDWSDEHNDQVFGALADPAGHEHDYHCVVTVAAPIDATMGMVIDLAVLDRILRDEVITPLDGTYINRDVPAFASGRPLPTCEAIAGHVFQRIAARLPAGVTLERVRVMEDPTLYADCTGIP